MVDSESITLKKYIQFLKRDTAFLILTISILISYVGNWFNYVALLATLDVIYANTMAFSIMRILDDFMPLLFSPFSGTITDKFDCKKIVIMTQIGCCLNVLLFIASYRYHWPWLFYLGIVIHSLLAGISSPAVKSYVTKIVDKNDLIMANTILTTGYLLFDVVAMALGGLALSAFGIYINLFIDMSSYAISIVFLVSLFIYIRKSNYSKLSQQSDVESGQHKSDIESPPQQSDVELAQQKSNIESTQQLSDVELGQQENVKVVSARFEDSWWKMFREGLNYLSTHPDVIYLTIFKCVVNIAMGALGAIDFYYAYKVFTSDDMIAGSRLFAFNFVCSAIVSCIVVYFIQKRTGNSTDKMRCYNTHAYTLICISFLFYAFPVHWSLWYVGTALFSSGNWVIYILIDTILQMEVDSYIQGRVFAYTISLRIVSDAIGVLVMGTLITYMRDMLWIAFISLSMIFMAITLIFQLMYIPSYHNKKETNIKMISLDTADLR